MSGESYLTKIIQPSTVSTVSITLPGAIQNRTTIDVLRLDLIHPVISGNKYFKLKYPLLQVIRNADKGIITFGGAYSNHLVALAYMTREAGVRSVGVVRGERPPALSPTLTDALGYGMELIFVSRDEYKEKDRLASSLLNKYPGYLLVPEGGQSADGVSGASEIASLTDAAKYDHIICAVGTGTMLAGLLRTLAPSQNLLGISALKIATGNEIEQFVASANPGRRFSINYEYHFGGYAKKTAGLISFMNKLWQEHQLPTDFVYTAKMFFGISKLLESGFFSEGSRILAIHSGGLQGNRSIATQLDFAPEVY